MNPVVEEVGSFSGAIIKIYLVSEKKKFPGMWLISNSYIKAVIKWEW